MTVEQIDQTGKTINSWSGLKDVTGVDSVAIGNVFGGDRDQVVLIIGRGDKKYNWQIVLDLPSKSFVLSDLKTTETYAPWKLFLADFNQDGLTDIWRYKLSGGSYPVYSLSNTVIDTINVPVLEREK